MKTIGKIAALAMTLSLAFVLTACGGSASSSAASSTAASSATTSASATSTSTSSTAASDSATSASAAASSTSSTADTYENQFFSIKFNLPQGWSFADPSAVKELNSAISSFANNAELDMAAASNDKSQLVIVAVEPPSDKNAGKTAEQYLEADVESLTSSMQGNYQMTTTSATITFQGIDRELPASITNLTVDGATLCIVEAVAEKDGNFFEAIVMAQNENDAVKTFENFSSIKA